MPTEITNRGTNDQVRFAIFQLLPYASRRRAMSACAEADLKGNRWDTRVDTSTGETGFHYSK